MKVSLNWLKDYVDLPADPRELARQLTMGGLEIEAIDSAGAALAGVVVAQVKASQKHPNADKLSVTQIDAGGGQLLQIVCGAKNYQVGDKVPLATIGTRLPNGTEIKQSPLRGVDSFGMLCSARELGLSEEASGLLILDPAAMVGAPIAAALGMEDTVFEVNVTPNRPDALSHLGIAREVAVLTRSKLKPPVAPLVERGGPAGSKVKITVEDSARCPRYAARVIEGVTVGPSPAWLASRLKACGVRSINNVVDVTNYVLLEYGQPLHAFDLDHLAGAEIVVRLARAGERLTTLDGKERLLDRDDLVIADRERAQVIAGVMGGAQSEVGAKTTRVLLEGASFQPSTVRRSSKRHAIHSESSHRFERGTDVGVIPAALDRAAALIAELAGGQICSGRVDLYPQPAQRRRVKLAYAQIGALLGAPVEPDEARRILEALGFGCEAEAQGEATFTVPLGRVDVERPEDLIEEVARIRGLDAIPAALPRSLAEISAELPAQELARRIRQALSGAGFDEVVNYSFVSPAALVALGEQVKPAALLNPLSAEQSVMRTTLCAGLLQNVSDNLRHQIPSIRLYELGRVYLPDPEGGVGLRPVTREPLLLAGALAGLREGRAWTATDKSAAMDFFEAKGAVEVVLSAIGAQRARFVPLEGPRYHPRAAATVMLGDRLVGSLGEVHPRVAKKLDIPAGVFLFELEVEALAAAAQLVPSFKQLTRFPAVLRDLSVVVGLEQPNDQVRQLIIEVGAPLVEDAQVFDVYTGKPIPEGKKNVAYALRYRALDRTLTDTEVNAAHQRIVGQVTDRLGARLRGSNP